MVLYSSISRLNVRRSIRFALIFILIGAIVNVAVAWSIELHRALTERIANPSEFLDYSATRRPTEVALESWIRPVPIEWPNRPSVSLMYHYPGRRELHQSAYGDNTNPLFVLDVVSSGWPFACLESWDCIPLWVSSRRGALPVRECSWSVRLTGPRSAELPLAPKWPSIALNTVFYAVVAWCGWTCVASVRQCRRRGRGACGRCGYSREGLSRRSRCPECGSL